MFFTLAPKKCAKSLSWIFNFEFTSLFDGSYLNLNLFTACKHFKIYKAFVNGVANFGAEFRNSG